MFPLDYRDLEFERHLRERDLRFQHHRRLLSQRQHRERRLANAIGRALYSLADRLSAEPLHERARSSR